MIETIQLYRNNINTCEQTNYSFKNEITGKLFTYISCISI